MAKGKRAITKDFYDALVDAYRVNPGNYHQASKRAACDYRTAKRGWHDGWPRFNFRPISKILEDEQISARAMVRRAAQDEEAINNETERMKAAEDAVKARAEESAMIRLMRNDVVNGLAATARVLPGIQKWATEANVLLQQSSPKTARDALRLMESAARVVDRLAQAADNVMAMERRLLGEPEMIVGHKISDISMEEAVLHVEAGQKTLERARKLGLLPPRVVDEAAASDAAYEIVDAEIVEPAEEPEAPEPAKAAEG